MNVILLRMRLAVGRRFRSSNLAVLSHNAQCSFEAINAALVGVATTIWLPPLLSTTMTLSTLESVKIISIFAVMTSAWVGGSIPLVCSKLLARNPNALNRLLSFLNCASAGFFVSASFLQLLPSAGTGWIKLFPASSKNKYVQLAAKYPISEALLLIGFLLPFIFQYTFKQRFQQQQQQQQQQQRRQQGEDSYYSIQKRSFDEIGGGSTEQDALFPAGANQDGTAAAAESSSSSSSGSSLFLATIVVSVLVVQSVMIGVAVGVMMQVQQVAIIFFGMVLHKSVAAFTLTTNLVKASVRVRNSIGLLFLFSLMTPGGTAIGLVLSLFIHGDAIIAIAGTFKSLGAGSFLYVGILGIMVEEFLHAPQHQQNQLPRQTSNHEDRDRFKKLVIFLVVVLIVALITIWDSS